MSVSAKDYRADIDGLRAVAILLVAVFHFKLFPLGDAGFIGVDVFFVISGFLITRILVGRLETGTFSLGEFYIARLRRLMPALVVTLVLFMAAGTFVFLPDRFAELSVETLLSQLYVVNIYFWRTINYFGLRADTVPLLHMWSLAVEEQFYLFYPLALMLVFRFARRWLLPVLVVTCALSFALGWFASGWKPEAAFYLLPTRAWELLAGGILALTVPRGLRPGPLAALAGPVGLALIVIAIAIHTPITPFPGWFAALPVGGAVLLILGGPASPAGRVLSLAPMVWIGKISYPFYLVHWPIIILTREVAGSFPYGWRWAGFFFAIALSWAIWRFVEEPVRNRRVLATPGRLLGGAALASACLIAVGFAGKQTDGFPGRFSPEVREVLAYSGDRPWKFMGCEVTKGNTEPCALGTKSGPLSVVVIGDSHAQAMAGALDLWFEGRGQNAALWVHHGCLPVLEADDFRCQAFLEKALAAAGAEGVETVYLASAWRHDPGVFRGRYLTGEAADRGFREALDATLARLGGAGRDVVLIDPVFYAAGRVPETLARNLHFGTDRPVDTSYDYYLAVNSRVFAIFDEAVRTHGVRRISLIGELCEGGTCRATLDGSPVFSDSNHIRFGMSPYFAGVLERLELSD